MAEVQTQTMENLFSPAASTPGAPAGGGNFAAGSMGLP